MKARRHRMSSSSSDDEVLLVLKQAKEDPNGYRGLREQTWEQCEFCDKTFSDRYTLYKHNTTHMIIPLIKKKAHQCSICLLYFSSTEELKTHTLKHHNKHGNINIQEIMPDILKSLVEKQVLVKCEDDINVIVNTKFKQNGKNKANDTKLKYAHSGRKAINNAGSTHIENSEIDHEDPNIVKEEPFSPTLVQERLCSPIDDEKEEPSRSLVKERLSSPIDDEKESVRHRLLFEEDIEDTLFRDISNECQVNIETLCQEVSFDFDNALVVSDSDETMSLGCNDSTNNTESGMNNFENVINNSANGMNNIENAINNSASGMNNFENIINNSATVMNNLENRINNYESVVYKTSFVNRTVNYEAENNCENGTKNYSPEIEYLINGMNNLDPGNQSNNIEILNMFFNESNVQDQDESQYGNSIHFDILMEPQIWVCRLCRTAFPNRFQLVQHEPVHLELKKRHRSSPLCVVCDRYIAGNHHSLRNHIKKKHPECIDQKSQTTHVCPKCNLKYHNYSRHLRNHHEAYNCGVCLSRFETLQEKNKHICGGEINSNGINLENNVNQERYAFLQLCGLCFSFMKIYFQNRQRYEEVGTKTELGVRQTCDKCFKEFFSVKLVRRRILAKTLIDKADERNVGKKASDAGKKASDAGQKALDAGQKAFDAGRKASDVGQKALDAGQKALDAGRKASDVGQKALDAGQKALDAGRKASDVGHMALDGLKASDFGCRAIDAKPKVKSKPMSNKDRLLKIQNRLKMLKMINKC